MFFCTYFVYNFTSAYSAIISAERSLCSSQNPETSLSVTLRSVFPMVLRVFFFTQEVIYSFFISIRGSSIFLVSYLHNYHKLFHTLSRILQAGRSRVQFPIVSLEFFFDIIFPAVLLSWG